MATFKAPTAGRPAQGFTTAKAQSWVLVSAVLTAVIYAFRKMVEPSTPPSKKTGKLASLVGAGQTPTTENWVISYGAAFMILSIVALGAPELAASLAIMALAGNLLTNGITLASDLTNLEGTVTPTSTNEATIGAATQQTATGAGAAVSGAAAGAAKAAGNTAAGAGVAASTIDNFTRGF